MIHIKNLIIIGIFLFLILVILLAIGYYFTRITLNPKAKDYDDTFKIEVNSGYINEEEYKSITKEEVYVDSNFGYKLHGIWFPNGDSKKTVIICHGFSFSLYGSVKYMNIFLKRGYNVLIYDHRYHGKSGGKICSMGFYEKYDLKTMVDYVIKRKGEDSIIGTHGESMGGATVLLHGAIDERISFIIADCPFSSVFNQFKYRLKIEYKLPSFPILYFSSLVTKFRINAFYKDISPIKVIDKIKTPILFIHGDSDTYVPSSNTIEMYNKKEGPKSIYLAKDGEHAKSYYVDKEKYENVIDEFLKEFKI